jgi:hypothetical protein
LDGEALSSLRRDLRRAPIDGPRRRVPGYANRPRQTGVIFARPPVYTITYRGRFQVFGGEYLAVDGAPIAEHIERMLRAREGTCRVTFHRP